MNNLFRTLFLLCALAAASKPAEDCIKFTDVRYAPRRAEVAEGDSSSDRLLDIYLPNSAKPSKGYPVFVFIHGGGFGVGDKAISKPMSGIKDSLLNHGYAFVSLNYFLYKKLHKDEGKNCGDQMRDGFPASGEFDGPLVKAIGCASDDAVLALNFLKKNARKFSLDMSRLAIGGGSAGAITCLDLAFVNKGKKPKVSAVVNMWGSISRVDKINTAEPAVLTIHGTADDIINYCYGEAICARLQELGSKTSRIIKMEGRPHASYPYVASDLMGDVLSFLDDTL